MVGCFILILRRYLEFLKVHLRNFSWTQNPFTLCTYIQAPNTCQMLLSKELFLYTENSFSQSWSLLLIENTSSIFEILFK